MAGTGFHPEGHVPVKYFGSLQGVMTICTNCSEVDPEKGSECIDDY